MYNKFLFAITLVLLIVMIYFIFFYKEGYTPFYLDAMAMKNDNPTWFVYNGDNRDILGMSHRDYYLQNQMMAQNGVQPFYHNNNEAQFNNTSDYWDMPKTYRPRSPIHDVELSDN